MKRLVAASLIAALVGAATAAGGQVIDHGKVVADPATDYRRYSQEIAAAEKADQARQAKVLSAAQQSVGEDEAAFQASLAAEAQSLNAGFPQPGADAGTSVQPLPATPEDPRHGLPAGVVIAIAAAALGGLVLIAIVLSALKDKTPRRRRQPKEDSVRLADFARKPDPGDK